MARPFRRASALLQVFRIERILAFGQFLAGMRLGDVEARRHARIEQPGALQFVEPRQVADGVEAEMVEKARVVP